MTPTECKQILNEQWSVEKALDILKDIKEFKTLGYWNITPVWAIKTSWALGWSYGFSRHNELVVFAYDKIVDALLAERAEIAEQNDYDESELRNKLWKREASDIDWELDRQDAMAEYAEICNGVRDYKLK